MILADMVTNYHDELVCDMAETYGVFDIKRVPARLLATLAVGLRDDSRVKQAKSKTTIDDNTMMLAYIVDLLRGVGIDDENSLRRFYLKPEESQKQNDYDVYSSPEEFMARRYGDRKG